MVRRGGGKKRETKGGVVRSADVDTPNESRE